MQEKAHSISQSKWDQLVRVVRRRTGKESEAEDLVQEAYLRLFSQPQSANIENWQGFVVRAAENLAVSTIRKDRVRSKAHADEAIRSLLAPPRAPPDEVLDLRERLRVVQIAVTELPDRARKVFIAHRMDGKTYREIAEDMGISVSAVEKNMARALTHLAVRLHDLRRGRGKNL